MKRNKQKLPLHIGLINTCNSVKREWAGKMGMQLQRSSERLIKPWKETPMETLELSGIDKLWILRCNARTLHVYKSKKSQVDASVFDVVSEAVSKALVPYYPLAGRLTFDSSSVECNAAGVLLVDASAACTLASSDLASDESHRLLLPPIQTGPLLQMQVTRFSCGGFVLGLVFSHTVCDGLGAAQFLNAVGELARGLPALSVGPVWCRRFFFPHSPPPPPPLLLLPLAPPVQELEHVKVEIKRDEIEEAKRAFRLDTGLTCSTFEVVAAALWRCRAKAAATPELAFFANCRHLASLPEGFYGNCFFPVRAREEEPLTLGGAVKLIQGAKAGLARGFGGYCRDGNAEEFLRPPSYEALYVSEWGRLGFNSVDVGWGPPERVVPMQGAPGIPAAVITRADAVTVDTWCVRRPHLQHFLHALQHLFR